MRKAKAGVLHLNVVCKRGEEAVVADRAAR